MARRSSGLDKLSDANISKEKVEQKNGTGPQAVGVLLDGKHLSLCFHLVRIYGQGGVGKALVEATQLLHALWESGKYLGTIPSTKFAHCVEDPLWISKNPIYPPVELPLPDEITAPSIINFSFGEDMVDLLDEISYIGRYKNRDEVLMHLLRLMYLVHSQCLERKSIFFAIEFKKRVVEVTSDETHPELYVVFN